MLEGKENLVTGQPLDPGPVSERPTWREAAEVFWPPSGHYHVTFLDLYPERLSGALGLEPQDLLQLVQLGNAIHRLQHTDGTFVSDPSTRRLLWESHDLLLKMACDARPVETARLLRRSAQRLVDGSEPILELSQVYAEDSELVLVCGPLATWDWKSPTALHSVMVARVDPELTEHFVELDRRLDELGHFLGEQIGVGRLWPTSSPRIVATELLLCGGEADTFPKQFAYFLKENSVQAADSRQGDVVLMFENVYTERFERLSLPLFEEFVGPLSRERREAARDPRWLLNWFKGHDVGHFLSYDADRATLLPEAGDADGAVLHEAMADVFGFLSLLGPWSPTGRQDRETSGTVFLSEMLRYMRRGITYFPDSSAAFLEFFYLERKGCLSFDRESRRLEWSPDGLVEGLSSLAKELSVALLRGDERVRRRLLEDYNPHYCPEELAELGALFRGTEHLPHDLAYRVAGR